MPTPAVVLVHSKETVFRFTVSNRATGIVLDTSSWPQFWFMVKIALADLDAAALVAKTLGSGIVAVNAAAGLYEVTVDPIDTASLANQSATYQGVFQGRDGNGKPWQLWTGAVVIEPSGVVAA